MSGSLISSSWYRVAGLKPRLRSHARLHRHRYRGEVWYLLQDPASGRIHRFSPAARDVIAALDGNRTVEEVWEIVGKRLGEAAPTQDEVIQLLGQLHSTDLLQSDVTPDIAELFARGEREVRSRRQRSFANPMAIRIPLWDPDAFLNRIQGLIRLIWSGWGALLWLVVVVPAVLLIPLHWPDLTNNFSDRVLAVNNLVSLYLVFPLIKLLHELGHATATKSGGGEVHDMGLVLLVLLPVPYVEASSATAFRSKYRRAVVGAAGVAVELFVAALAFYLWMLIEPGPIRAVLFNVMLIAGVSTLIFNGNPLLRYDAYYVLADLIEIPNLAARALGYWGYLIERYALGVPDIDAPAGSRMERVWFIVYSTAASVYRVLVTVVIALFIASRFFIIGILLAGWALVAMAVLPIVRGIRHLLSSPRLRGNRRRALAVSLGSVVALLVFLLAVPVPQHSHAEGVVWLPEQAMVRAGSNGFIDRLLIPSGTPVKEGEPLVLSYNPQMSAGLRLGQAWVAELEAQYGSEFATEPVRAAIAREKLDSARSAQALAEEHASELIANAHTDGVFIAPQAVDMPGRFYRKGELLGYVVGTQQPFVRVVVPQDSVDMVRAGTQSVHVRLVDHPEQVVEGRVVREAPAGESYLPSRALATEGGGNIAIDPRDTKGAKALQRMFQFDVAMENAPQLDTFGERAYVRFDHRMEPLAVRWYRAARLLFLSRFGV